MGRSERGRVGMFLFAVVATTAVLRCGPDLFEATPGEPTARQLDLAHGLLDSYSDWDQDWAAENFNRPRGLRARLVWLRERLGDCSRATPILVRSPKAARFIYECEHGQFEAEFVLAHPTAAKVNGLLIGGRDLEPHPSVRAAAAAALQLMDEWDRDRADELLASTYDLDEIAADFAAIKAKRGSCRLEQPDLANEFGALWFVDCDAQPMLLKTELGPDRRIRQLFLWEPRPLRTAP